MILFKFNTNKSAIANRFLTKVLNNCPSVAKSNAH